MDVLTRIKKLAGRVEFTLKAEEERLLDGLRVEDVLESILNATTIRKTLRSSSAHRTSAREKLFIVESPSSDGVWIYTKGTIRRKAGSEIFYVLISSKISEQEQPRSRNRQVPDVRKLARRRRDAGCGHEAPTTKTRFSRRPT